jgi:hypothetical protein
MALIGVCGDDCSYCPRYSATQNGKSEDLERVKELWVRLGFWDPAFPAKDLTCHGCGPNNRCAYPELRTCAYKKNSENCGLCNAYPCELMRDAFVRTERLHPLAMSKCTSEEMDILNKAFFHKKQVLDQINRGAKKS